VTPDDGGGGREREAEGNGGKEELVMEARSEAIRKAI